MQVAELGPSDSAPRFNLVDLFAGVGGITLGFMDSSSFPACAFVPRLLVDVDRDARDVVARNLPEVPYLVRDVHKLSGREIRDRAGLRPNEPVHVLVGGPPCQGFSGLGRRALSDPRNAHLVDFLNLVRELQPLVALLENVPQIVHTHKGHIAAELCDWLATKAGYCSCADILVASDYGVPQFRKRAFVLAYRADLGKTPAFPSRTHERVTHASLMNGTGRVAFEDDRIRYVSVQEAIGDLPAIEAGGGEEYMFYDGPPASEYQRWARRESVAIFNHRSRAHSAEFLEKISVIGEGGRNTELPENERFSDNYYSQAYARLHRDGIGHTITTHFGNPGSGRFTHYRDLRAITVREAARFQSFPDTFVFDGHHATQMRHVGNAVPPLLARALRDHIARDLLQAGGTISQTKATSKKTTSKKSVTKKTTSKKSVTKKAATKKAATKKGRTRSAMASRSTTARKKSSVKQPASKRATSKETPIDRASTKKAPAKRRETPEERSRVMRAVPSEDTSAELALRKAIYAAGLRGYRLNKRDLPGKPDIVFTLPRVAVFVDGCFWHGCPACYRAPQSNVEYWSVKVERNQQRDERVSAQLEGDGWEVVRVWEHEVTQNSRKAASRVRTVIRRRERQVAATARKAPTRRTAGGSSQSKRSKKSKSKSKKNTSKTAGTGRPKKNKSRIRKR